MNTRMERPMASESRPSPTETDSRAIMRMAIGTGKALSSSRMGTSSRESTRTARR